MSLLLLTFWLIEKAIQALKTKPIIQVETIQVE